jgi:hypothetical protein
MSPFSSGGLTSTGAIQITNTTIGSSSGGALQVTGGVQVNAASFFSGGLTLNTGNAVISNGGLTVSGITLINDATAGSSTSGALQVAGGAKISGASYFGSTLTINTGGLTVTAGGVTLSSGNIVVTQGTTSHDTGNATITANSTANVFQSRYASTTDAVVQTNVSIVSTGLMSGLNTVNRALYVSSSGSTGKNYAAIFENGQVGIGTIAPTAGFALDVVGTTRISLGLTIVANGFTVTGGSTITGTLSVSSTLSANGGLSVASGQSTLINDATAGSADCWRIANYWRHKNGPSSYFGGGLTINSGGLTISGGNLLINSGSLQIASGTFTVSSTGSLSISDTTAGSATTGAIQISGGIRTGAASYFGGGLTINSGGLSVVAGGASITAGGLSISGGGLTVSSGQTVVINDTTSASATAGALQVAGGIKVSGVSYFANGFYVNAGGIVLTAGGLTVSSGGITVASGQNVIINDTTSGTSTTGALQIAGGAKISGTSYFGNAVTIYQGGLTLGGALSASGNVDTSGYVRAISPNNGTTGGVIIRDAASDPGKAILQFTNNAVTAQYSYISAKTGGLLGIGTVTPVAPLDVAGNIRSTGEIRSSEKNGLRVNRVMFRDDGSNFYLLVGIADTPGDNWTPLRPFFFNTTSGLVQMQNGLYVTGKASGDVAPRCYIPAGAFTGNASYLTDGTTGQPYYSMTSGQVLYCQLSVPNNFDFSRLVTVRTYGTISGATVAWGITQPVLLQIFPGKTEPLLLLD